MKRITALLLGSVLLFSACSFPGLGASSTKDSIVVASGNTSERQILSNIVLGMIHHYRPELSTGIVNNLGSTFLIVQSVERKDTNVIGANYTGTSLTGELGMEATTDPALAFSQVVKGYSEKMDMIWFPSYGFGNTFAFMVTEKFAEENHLKKVSDLEGLRNKLRVGVDVGWMDRPGDGYAAFQEIYGFSFDTLRPMEIGLVYDALRDKKMDVVLGYSTDGRIQSNQLVLLEDDRHLFPPYDASPVASKALLKKYPELEEVFLKLEGEIDSSLMQEMNRRCDEDKTEPKIVAVNFLREHRYFEDKKVKPLREREIYRDLIEEEERGEN